MIYNNPEANKNSRSGLELLTSGLWVKSQVSAPLITQSDYKASKTSLRMEEMILSLFQTSLRMEAMILSLFRK